MNSGGQGEESVGCCGARRCDRSDRSRFYGEGDVPSKTVPSRRLPGGWPLQCAMSGADGIRNAASDFDLYTQSRLRPFARRRANTNRPPLVAIRARKPWVRLRCKLLG